MAFMMKKKKYKFNVEVQLQDLVEVALVNEVLFAKIRLLEGGSFQEYSSREEVKNHRVEWNRSFQFPCKMSANASTGVLDPSHLRISIRKEMKGGRSYFKLGFIDINLAEFAGAGLISRRFLLEGYDSRHRLDNSMLRVTIKMHMLSGDILFKAPTPSIKSKEKPSTDDLSTASTGGGLQTPTANAMPSIGMGSGPPNAVGSGGGGGGGVGLGSGIVSSNRPISTLRDDVEQDPQSLIAAIVTDSGLSESSESATTAEQLQQPAPCPVPASSQALSYVGVGSTGSSIASGVVNNSPGLTIIGSNNCGTTSSGGIPSGIPITSSIIEMGHSRNSSNTSQLSKGSGYSSFSHSQHSRQSSEGDSGHARLNQRTLNAMQLSLPTAYTNQRTMSATVAITECADDVSEKYETPNATLLRDEEFRTPLNELPQNSTAGGLSAQALYGATQSLSPTYYSIASSGSSRNGSHDSQICDESGSDSDAADSGLDENYHTPRVAKIKSMENLSLLEMEFHKASQEMDRNSPRRLKLIAEHASFPKMKSLNNLCMNNYTDDELKEEFTRMREHSIDEKQRFQFQQRKYSNSSSKRFTKNKVGNAKFIGGDETPELNNAGHSEPFNYRNVGHVDISPHPIQKMRSMGTIPDVLGERIEPDPFLTPTSGRKPQFPFVTQSAEKPIPPSYLARLLNSNDMVDGQSLQDYYTQNLYLRMASEPATAANMTRSPFERAYKRSAIKSSTPLRQSISHIQHQAAHDTKILQQQPFALAQKEPSSRRPHSTNAAYDLMRSYSGVPRRLLDGSNRQISFIALTNTNSPSNASASTYGTLGSLNSTHSVSSSSGSSSSSGALITYQHAHGTDTVDAPIPLTVHTPVSGRNSPRLVHLSSVELGSLAASPTDACNLLSNLSSASHLATATAAAALETVASSTGCTLSPLPTTQIIRRPSITMNPSSGSLVISETGSLDRTKNSTEKRKKGALDDGARVSDRVEETRVNPNSLIDEILKDTKLDQLEESAESSGLQLYIARDGTASLGSHEVKSRVNSGSFKQVVMQNPR